jgi:hypothetical protein
MIPADIHRYSGFSRFFKKWFKIKFMFISRGKSMVFSKKKLTGFRTWNKMNIQLHPDNMRFWQSFMRRLFKTFFFSVWTYLPFAKKFDLVIQNGFVIDGSGNLLGWLSTG